MEKIGGRPEEGRVKEKGIIPKVRRLVARSAERRRRDKLEAVLDLLVFAIGLVFARRHVIFGAHPLSIALVAALPSRVFTCAIGSVIGALSLGKAGIIYAMITLIVVFLRMIVSEGDGEGTLFRENLLLRMCVSLIGGFVGAIYEVLLSGFTLTTVLFGASMILASPLVCFMLSGCLDSGYDVRSLLFSDDDLLSLRGRCDRERYSLVFFEISALILVFLVSVALAEYIIFGINLSYIAAALVTVVTARRFGSVPAMAVGFAASFGLSGVYSVAFALLGLVAGVLFPIGPLYALTIGGSVMCAWCAYTGGVGGFLTTLPEYAISALLSMPIISRISYDRTVSEEERGVKGGASELLGLASLSYKNRYTGSLDALEASLSVLSGIIKEGNERHSHPGVSEIREVIDECIENYMLTPSQAGDGLAIPEHVRDKCAERMSAGTPLTASDLAAGGEESPLLAGLAESINRAVALLAEEKYRRYKRNTSAEDMSLISSLIAEARSGDEKEKAVNETLTARVREMAGELGLVSYDARVYGVRRPCFLIACEDESGEKIKNADLKKRIEELLSVRLEGVEYYKNGTTALFEARAGKKLLAECASVSRVGSRDKISGDTHRATESADGRFYTVICDGMGSGREAKEISELAADILSRTLELLPFSETLLAMLNHMISGRGDECSVTVDLFSLDLVTGKGAFIKSGAAASYVKRGDSLFRIRSHTAPLGLMRELDSEAVKVDVSDGDYVIMLSDGVSQNMEDSPWLYTMLSSVKDADVKELALRILDGARENTDSSDDMTVSVTRIRAIK